MAYGNNDNRIVEMRFENREFEQNIAKSQKSLERFKKELDFKEASKGLEEFAQTAKESIQFNTMADNIQKLTDKFTGLGHVGEFVISRIRRSLESMGDKVISFTNSLTTVQQSAGFAKYESLNKAVQTLKSATGKEEKEIYGVLQRLTKYTDETSYDMAEGVTSISKLVSSGAAGLKQAEITIEGFYNMAAKAGADTRTAAHALQYSLTQAMSAGFMGYNDWKTLENSSLATIDFKTALLDEAVALKKATKEGDKYFVTTKKGKKVEVNATNLWKESLKEQWVTVDILNGALAKYADTTTEFGAEAYAAAQRCTTFTDALNAWKDMLASGWMQTYRTLFGDLGEAMNLFSSFCNKVSDALDGLVSSRNRLLKVWKTSGGRDTLWGMLMGEMETPEGEIMFEGQRGILDMITGAGEMIQGAFWDMVKETMSEEDKASLEMWAGNAEAIMGLLKQNGMLDGLTESELEELQEFISTNFNERGFLQMYLGERLAEATKNVQGFIERVHEWFNVVDDSTGTTRFQKLQVVLQAIMNTVRFIAEIIGGIIDFVGELLGPDHLGPAIDSIIDLFSALGIAISDTENNVSKSGGIKTFFHALAEVLKPVTKFISNAIILITELIRSFASWGKESGAFAKAFETVKTVLKSIFDTLKTVTAPIGKLLMEIGEIVKDLFRNGFSAENLANAGARIREAFINMFAGLKEAAAPVLEKIGQFFANVWQAIKDFFVRTFTGENLAFVWEAVKSFFSGIFSRLGVLLGPIGEKVGGFFSGLWSTISNAVSGFISGNPLFAKLLDWLKGSFQKILDFFGSIGSLFKGEGNFIQKIKGAFEGVFGTFKDFNLSNILQSIAGPLGIAGAGTLIYGIVKMIRGDGKNGGLSAIFNAIGTADKNANTKSVDSFVTKFLAFSSGVLLISASIMILEKTKVFERIGKLFTSVFDAFKDIGNFKMTKPMKGIVAIGAVVLALTVLTRKIGKMTGAMEGGRQGGAGAVESFASKLLKFAAAMGLLAVAVKALESTGTFQKLGSMFKKAQETFSKFNLTTILQQIAGPLKVIGTYLLAFELIRTARKIATAFQSLSDTLRNGIAIKGLGQAERAGDRILKIAGAIAILTGCIYLIGNMDTEKAIQGVVGLIALMSVLGVFSKLMTKVMKQADWKNLVGMASSFISIGIGIGAILLSLKPIMSLEGPEAWDKVLRSLAALAGVLTAIGVFMWLTRDLGKTYGKDTKRVNQFKGFLMMAAGVYILIKALTKITELDWNPEKGESQLKKLAWVVGGLAAFFVACAGAVRLAGKGSIKDLGLFAAGLAVLLFSLKSIAQMDAGSLATMFTSLSVVLLEFVGFAYLLRKSKGSMKDTGLKEAAWLSLGIAVLIRALLPVANLYDKEGQSHWEKLGMMGATLGGILLGLGVFAKLMSKVTLKGSGFGSIVTLAVGIFAILLALKPVAKLANMENGWEKLGMMLATFGVIIGGIIILGRTMNNATFKKKGLGAILVIAAGILAIVLALLPIANIAKQANGLAQLLSMGGAFAVILGGLAGVAILMQKHAGSWKKAKAGIVSLIVLVAALAFTLDILRPMAFMDWEKLGKIGASYAVIIAGFALILNQIDKLGTSKNKITAMAVALGGIALVLATAAAGLYAIKDIDMGHIFSFIVGLGAFCTGMFALNKYWGASTWAQIRNFVLEFVAIAGLMLVAAASLVLIKDVNAGTIAAFFVALGAFCAGIFALNKYWGVGTWAKAKVFIAELASIAGLILIAAVAMRIIPTDLDWSTIGMFFLGIAGVSAVILGMSRKLKVQKFSKILPALAIIGSIAVLMLVAAASLRMIPKDIKWDTILAFTGGFSIMMLAMAASIKILKGVDLVAGLKAILLVAGGLVVILEAMSLIADNVASNVGNAFVTVASSMDLAIQMLADFMDNMNRFTEADTESAKRKIGMLKDIFSEMNGFSSYVKDVEDFTTVLFELGVMLPYFHEMTKDIPDPDSSTAIKTINKLIEIAPSLQSLSFGNGAVVIAELGAGLAVFNELANTVNGDFAESPAIKLLDLLMGKADQMTALTQAGDIGTQLARIGAGLHHFVTGTDELGNGLNKIPDDAMEMPGIKLIQALADSASGIKTIATMTELNDLADRLTLLGGAMSIYALGANEYAQTGDNGELKNFNVDQAAALLRQVAKSLGGENSFEIPNLPEEGNLTRFGAQLAALGGGMLKFIQSCDGISGKTQQGLDAISLLAGIKKDLTAETIQVFEVFGDKSGTDELSQLGTDLSVVATGLSDFIKASEGITGNTQKGLDAIGFLAEIRTKLMEDNNAALEAISIFGENGVSLATLSSFGLELWVLASGLQSFIGASNGINGNTQEGLGAIEYLANLKDQLVKVDLDELTAKIEALGAMDDGTFDIMNESSALGRFGAEIIELGGALSQFVEKVNFPPEYQQPFEHAKEALEYFRRLQSRMPRDKGGLVEFFIGHAQDMGSMSQSINSLGTAMGSFASSLNQSNYDIAKVDSAVKGVDTLIWAAIHFTEIADVYDSSSTPVDLNKVHNFFTSLNSDGKNLGQVIGQFFVEMSESMSSLSLPQIETISGSIDSVTNMVEKIVGLNSTYWKVLADSKAITGVDIGYSGASNFISLLFRDFEALVSDAETQSRIGDAVSILNTVKDLLAMVISVQEGVLSLDPGITAATADSFAQVLVGFLDSFVDAVNLSENGMDLNTAGQVADTIHDLATAVSEIASMSEADFTGSFGEGLKPLGALLTGGIRDGLSSDSSKALMLEGLRSAIDYVIEDAPKDTELLTKATKLGSTIVGMMNFGMVSSMVGAGYGQKKLSFADQLRDSMGFDEIGGMLRNQTEKFKSGEATASLYDVVYIIAYRIGDYFRSDECGGLITAGLSEAFSKSAEDAWTIGWNISEGVANGIKDGTYLVQDASKAVADAAKLAFMTETDEQSPSRVFAVLGGYLSEGVAVGITEKEGAVIASAEGMANDAINTVTTLMATLSTLMSQDIDSNPTITPVIDLSNVNSGASFIQSLFGGQGFSLGVGVGAEYAQRAVPRTGRSTGEYQGTDLTGITNKITELGNKITDMGERITNMQIVLDTGALVGGVSGGVNSDIGKKTVYGRRRNA